MEEKRVFRNGPQSDITIMVEEDIHRFVPPPTIIIQPLSMDLCGHYGIQHHWPRELGESHPPMHWVPGIETYS